MSVAGTDRGLSLFEAASRTELAAVADNEMHIPVFPNGCHACEVAVDPETGSVEILRYTAVDDVGRAINPLIVDGQIHGGIVQGLGQAMWEQCVTDQASHQPVCGSFMDYAMPRADHFPSFTTALNEVRSPTNPLGVKAGGEGGTTPAPAAVVNAIVGCVAARLASPISRCRRRRSGSGRRSGRARDGGVAMLLYSRSKGQAVPSGAVSAGNACARRFR